MTDIDDRREWWTGKAKAYRDGITLRLLSCDPTNRAWATEVMREAVAEIERLREAVRAEREAAAQLVDDECQRILAKITPADPASFGDMVNRKLRMIAVLLPDLAAAIRARGNFSSESDKNLHEGE